MDVADKGRRGNPLGGLGGIDAIDAGGVGVGMHQTASHIPIPDADHAGRIQRQAETLLAARQGVTRDRRALRHAAVPHLAGP